MGEGVFFPEFSLNIFYCLINVNMKMTASYIYNKCMHNIFDKQKWWKKRGKGD